MDIQEIAWTGVYVGAGVALIPAAATSLIACSKIIMVNIIADLFMRLITLNTYTLSFRGVSFVEVPFLWQVSFYAALTGTAILLISLATLLADKIYRDCIARPERSRRALPED